MLKFRIKKKIVDPYVKFPMSQIMEQCRFGEEVSTHYFMDSVGLSLYNNGV